MTPICTEHAALLKAIAKNLNDRAPILAYSDWLQENSNPGHFVVIHYPPWEWAVPADPKYSRSHWGNLDYSRVEEWRLPWLEGTVTIEPNHNRRTVTKAVLTAFAEGLVK